MRRRFPPYRAYDGENSARRLAASLAAAAVLHSLLLLLADPRASFLHLSARSGAQGSTHLIVTLAPAPEPAPEPILQAAASRPAAPIPDPSSPPGRSEAAAAEKTVRVPEARVQKSASAAKPVEKSVDRPLEKAMQVQVAKKSPPVTKQARIKQRPPPKKAKIQAAKPLPPKRDRARIAEKPRRKSARLQAARRSPKPPPQAAENLRSEKAPEKVTQRIRSEKAATALRALGSQASGAQSPSATDRKADSEPVLARLSTAIAPRNEVARPLYRKNPPPEYPRRAKRRGYQGVVALSVLVDVEGRVNDLKVARSSGYSILDRAAIRSVRKWDFQPGLENGRRIEMWVEVPVRFQLQSR